MGKEEGTVKAQTGRKSFGWHKDTPEKPSRILHSGFQNTAFLLWEGMGGRERNHPRICVKSRHGSRLKNDAWCWAGQVTG